MLKALERGDLAEASFKFWITAGQWSPDYTEFRINETDLDHGDVSSVNFGANPAASSGLRSAGPNADLRVAARQALRAAATRLQARALAPAEQAALSTLLLEITAADAVLDPLVQTLCAADCALDSAEVTLAALLGLPAPVEDEPMADPSADSADRARARARALAAL